MLRYVGRRLLQTIPVFFGATFLIYAMVYLMPGDPVAALGGQHQLSPDVAARIRAEYNLDKPFWLQYLLYLRGVLTLNFGTTFSGQPVGQVIAHAFPITARLAIYAIILETVFGILFGVLSGIHRGGLFDSTMLVLSLVLISVPTFVIGFLLQFFIGVRWGVLPTTVGVDINVRSLTMPAFVLAAQSFAYVLRLTRQSVSEHTAADFVRTAKAKGLTKNAVLTRHILRNSLIPVVTFLGGDLGALMSGAIVTEGIFAINGIGGTLWQGILKGEPATVVSITTVMVLIYIAANLLVDLLYAVLDPRIRYE